MAAMYLESARHAAGCARRSAHHALTVCRDDEEQMAYWMASAGFWMKLAFFDYDQAHQRIARAARRDRRAS